MKQILITPEIKAMAEEYSKKLFADKPASFVQPVDGLKNLILDLKEVNDGLAHKEMYIKYLEQIIKDYDVLKELLPKRFTTFKRKYDRIIKDCSLSIRIKYRRSKLSSIKAERDKLSTKEKAFYELIIARMHYDDTRLYMGPYMKRIGINTCVYCNLAKATYSEKLKEVYYPFDHRKPKNEYPFLCISFFNLYPSCTECNGHKLDDESKGFDLYIESMPISDPFVFEIDRSKIEEGNPDTVKVDFHSRKIADKKIAEKYNTDFRIEEFYNSDDEKRSNYQMQKLIYSHSCSYSTSLAASVPSVDTDRQKIFTDVLGVKDDEIIFSDPRKKLKIDTAKDAGLL